jgi:hypothetical protein
MSNRLVAALCVAGALASASQSCWASGTPITSDGHQWSFVVLDTNGLLQVFISAEKTEASNAPTKEMAVRAAELYRRSDYPKCRFEYENEDPAPPNDVPGWNFALQCPYNILTSHKPEPDTFTITSGDGDFTLSDSNDTISLNGKPITCAEMKSRLPVLFDSSPEPALFNDKCKRVPFKPPAKMN